MKSFTTLPILILSTLAIANPIAEPAVGAIAAREPAPVALPVPIPASLEKRKKSKGSSGTKNTTSDATTLQLTNVAGLAMLGAGVVLLV